MSTTSTMDAAALTAQLCPRLLDAHQVAARLGCSARHVIRLADRGAMPRGLKVGALRRWDAEQIDAWISTGCRNVRS
jgi:excisionase family DNA binding protein